MKWCATLVIAGTLLLLTSSRAAAWNSIGHMAVAKLAYDQLEQKQQLAVYNLRVHHFQEEVLRSLRNDLERALPVSWANR